MMAESFISYCKKNSKNKKVCRVETKMRWCTLRFTSPTFLLPNRFAFLPDSNVGEVNPNVHHLILVSTLHTFFVTTCSSLFFPFTAFMQGGRASLEQFFVLY